MTQTHFIYVHGFNSSPASIKARILGDYLEGEGLAAHYSVPALSHWPAEAMAQLEALVADPQQPVLLVGSSLGGFYSTALVEKYPHCRCALVNPAVAPQTLLAGWLGDNENLYTHEHYQLTPLHLAQLEALVCPELHAQERYLLLQQSGDETLDYREAVARYAGCVQFVQPGGSHGFDRFENLLPAILAFAAGRIELPEPVALPFSQLSH
ncbi:YqiA/YcfP family alpha/beta fold hydrolase [Marinobacterium sedimentorum]|uniref:YqiA/YcfP family alpha/beta fold hydrolase n=1 Tax=Marinobacterium sedimentorum TaxID=2927804 RepID=UPI0020C6D469|nr:YqiA/YcfP family alpha/beta fold hydrolase [Marinobacterium sedimentorum]MCP8686021.1 esterase [Marinobacterium sedimentorum]